MASAVDDSFHLKEQQESEDASIIAKTSDERDAHYNFWEVLLIVLLNVFLLFVVIFIIAYFRYSERLDTIL